MSASLSFKSFEAYKAQAAAYYQTPEYTALTEELRSVLSGIRDRVIAVDLEGTLVSFKLPLSVTNDNPYRRFDRPLADVFLQTLMQHGNAVFLWTAVTFAAVNSILYESNNTKLAGLVLFTQEENRCFARSDGVEKLLEQADLSSEQSDFLALILRGQVKVPVWFERFLQQPIDVLLDDFADRHRAGCLFLAERPSSEQIVGVPPFAPSKLSTPSELDSYYTDQGLLVAARDLAAFFAH